MGSGFAVPEPPLSPALLVVVEVRGPVLAGRDRPALDEGPPGVPLCALTLVGAGLADDGAGAPEVRKSGASP